MAFKINNNKDLFNAAHAMAREMRNEFATYREAFAYALKYMWSRAKDQVREVARKAARKARKAAEARKAGRSNARRSSHIDWEPLVRPYNQPWMY